VYVKRNEGANRKRNPLRAETRAMIMIDRQDAASLLRDIFFSQNLQSRGYIFDAGFCVPAQIAAAQKDEIPCSACKQTGRVGILWMIHKEIPQVLMKDISMNPSTRLCQSGQRLRENLIVKQFG
jgi:hypothetical protein